MIRFCEVSILKKLYISTTVSLWINLLKFKLPITWISNSHFLCIFPIFWTFLWSLWHSQRLIFFALILHSSDRFIWIDWYYLNLFFQFFLSYLIQFNTRYFYVIFFNFLKIFPFAQPFHFLCSHLNRIVTRDFLFGKFSIWVFSIDVLVN